MWIGSELNSLCASANEESGPLVNNAPLTGGVERRGEGVCVCVGVCGGPKISKFFGLPFGPNASTSPKRKMNEIKNEKHDQAFVFS